MATTNPSLRPSYLQTAMRPSSKIYEFFGFARGNTPPLGRLEGGDFAGTPMQDLGRRDEGSTDSTEPVLDGQTTHRNPSNASEGTHQVSGAADGDPNGQVDPPPFVIKKKASHHRTCCRALIQDFGLIWFTFSLDTALLALLMQVVPDPYHPDFLQPLAAALLLVSLALFVLTLLLVIIRLLWFRLSAVYELIAVPVEAKSPNTPQIVTNTPPPPLASSTGTSILTLGYFPTALLTLVAAATVRASTLPTLHPALPIALYAVFWVGVAIAVITTLLTLTNLFAHPHPGRRTAKGRYLRSLVLLNSSLALATVSVPAGLLVTQFLPVGALAPRLTPPPLVVALLLLGASFLLASAAYAALVHELLLVTGWPAPPQTPTMFLLVAAPGQAAAGLVLVGEAVGVAGPTTRGMSAATARAVDVVCVVLALLFLGMAAVWLLLGVVGTVRHRRTGPGEARWSLLWNGVMFPVGTVALAAAVLGTELESRGFGVVAVGLVVCCVMLWVVNLGFTVMAVVAGKVLVVRRDPRGEGEGRI